MYLTSYSGCQCSIVRLDFFEFGYCLRIFPKIVGFPLDLFRHFFGLVFKVLGYLFHVFNSLDFNLRVFGVPGVCLAPFSPIAYGIHNRPKADVVFCLADPPSFADFVQAVVFAAPIRIAGGIVYKVEAVVVFEVCARDLYDVAVLISCPFLSNIGDSLLVTGIGYISFAASGCHHSTAH